MCQSNKSPPQYKKTILAMEGRDRGQLPAPTILLFNFIKRRSRLDARKSLLELLTESGAVFKILQNTF